MIADRYREVAPLGEGGVCGPSLRCFDTIEQCEVAVKMIETHGGLFGPWDEARHLRQLSDPHILPIRNALEDLGQPILVTEIAEGGTVADRIVGDIGIAPLQAIDWIRQACLGIARAHSSGLIHHDIKPGNLFLSGTGRCMVGDFGFATLVDPGSGTAQMFGTTPSTGAPEAIAGALTQQSTATCASDIFSLGATLYWMLAGVPPIPLSLSYQQSKEFVEGGKVAALKRVAPHVGDYTCRVVARAMSPNFEDRHQSASDLHADLGGARTAEVSGRQWHPVPCHTGHENCWIGTSGPGRKEVRLCLVPTATGYEIEGVYAASGRRLHRSNTTRASSAEDLRRLFKTI